MLRTCLTLALSAVLWACSSSITFPEDPPYIEGGVVQVFDDTASIWVKEDSTEECGARFHTDVRTRIGERTPDGSVKRRAFSALTVGTVVRVWVPPEHKIADSCPARAFADAIEILPG